MPFREVAATKARSLRSKPKLTGFAQPRINFGPLQIDSSLIIWRCDGGNALEVAEHIVGTKKGSFDASTFDAAGDQQGKGVVRASPLRSFVTNILEDLIARQIHVAVTGASVGRKARFRNLPRRNKNWPTACRSFRRD
ncbi:hypothetical protein J2W42_003054 [Rhizobium tibeticum]|uniref:hypothetical protein n=1 Tax=Rhizobium tibeticum TaxID=501024 RepID=UPI002784C310|nr:hypothetical protein [Rhizobium tibeticum]MDP9810193.1 hypothetical protein [Rhizobium tibeticum]